MIDYHWRRSLRAKQLQVRITPWQGVEVVIPARTSKARVRSFLARQRVWIRDTWTAMRSEIADVDQILPVEIDLRALGKCWKVQYKIRQGARVRIISGSGVLTVQHSGCDESACRLALRRWLVRTARSHFGATAERMSVAMGSRWRRLQIRGQKGRWGSYSSNGTLSLNYKLLFLEPELVRYLLVHELAHAHILNHSARFWSLVAKHETRWRSLDVQLGEAWREIPGWVEMR